MKLFPGFGIKHFAFLLLLSSCGYHFENKEALTAISVPYVVGDSEGKLTQEIIRHLVSSGVFECDHDAPYSLQVAFVDDILERVGYRYSREEATGKLKNHLFPTEGRRIIATQVSLVDNRTDEMIFGPCVVKANVDFDYIDQGSVQSLTFVTPRGFRESTLTFSLGQLDSPEGAQDDALSPLYRELARKIVEGLLAHGI